MNILYVSNLFYTGGRKKNDESSVLATPTLLQNTDSQIHNEENHSIFQH